MLIDWLTLRTEISSIQEQDLLDLMPYFAEMRITNIKTDELIRTKLVIDIDSVRSDFAGMVWSISSNGETKYLNIGASPASLQHGNNLFGSLDYQQAKDILINHAKKVLPNVFLFRTEVWNPRRLDITQNYFMQSNYQVKDALHTLRSCDGSRQKATVNKGDSVYWGYSSHYRSGKAYDKYTQALELNKKALTRKKQAIYSQQQLDLMKSILRLELKLGRQFFDELPDESSLTSDFLIKQHETFFRQFIGDCEVTTMDTLFESLQLVAPSYGRAQSAYDTYLRIKQNGIEFTKFHMPRSTYQLHKKYLIAAGLSDADLFEANIIPLRKRRIDLEPVNSWQDLEYLNKKIA
jgi:II/X family phage/plasmid replication protein